MKTNEKLKAIRPFVKLKIPANKKLFTASEKGLISRYYNILEKQGYFDSNNDFYASVNIERHKNLKIAGAPKIKTRLVRLPTTSEKGVIKVDKSAKVKIRNGKIYVDRNGAPSIWRFQYNIGKNWIEKAFIAHIKKQIGKAGLKKNQFFAVGAGLKYEVRGTKNDSLTALAREILKIGFSYTSNLTASYEDRNQVKQLKDWLQEIIVYETAADTLLYKPLPKRGASRGKKKKNSRN